MYGRLSSLPFFNRAIRESPIHFHFRNSLIKAKRRDKSRLYIYHQFINLSTEFIVDIFVDRFGDLSGDIGPECRIRQFIFIFRMAHESLFHQH